MSTIKELKKIIREELDTYIEEACGCGDPPPVDPSAQEAKMHRTTLAHLMADVEVLLDIVEDSDDLPEWVESKIIKAGDYISSVARHMAGDVAREQGQLQEKNKPGLWANIHAKRKRGESPAKPGDKDYPETLDIEEALIVDGVYEDGSPLEEDFEFYEILEDFLQEAEYQGRKVTLNKPTRGDVKKFKVYVKDPKTGNVKKVNFGDPNMRIKKSNPKRRKSFRARHNCDNPGPKTKARYWSCKKW